MRKIDDLNTFLMKFRLIDEKETNLKTIKADKKNINDMYSPYIIKKKNGKARIISVPDDELKKLQKTVASIFERAIFIQDKKKKSFILSDGNRYLFNYGNSSYGFEKGKNIKMNAESHANHQFLFKTDISKFFDSFDIGMVRKTVHTAFRINDESIKKQLAYRHKNKYKINYGRLYLFDYDGKNKKQYRQEKYITALLCHNGRLATGSPASPFVANLYMRPFDLKVNIWLKNLEIKTGNEYTYTRYADDICISSNAPIPKKVINYIQTTLKEFKLKMNEEKTVLQTNKAKNVITGINVTSDGRVTVGRKKKEEIKDMLYHYMVLNDNKYSEYEVKGNINYLKQIEPEYANKVIKKYEIIRKRPF